MGTFSATLSEKQVPQCAHCESVLNPCSSTLPSAGSLATCKGVYQTLLERLITKLGHGANAGKLAYINVADLKHDDKYLYMTTGSLIINSVNESANTVITRTSLATSYGRKIYWTSNGAVKHEETI